MGWYGLLVGELVAAAACSGSGATLVVVGDNDARALGTEGGLGEASSSGARSPGSSSSSSGSRDAGTSSSSGSSGSGSGAADASLDASSGGSSSSSGVEPDAGNDAQRVSDSGIDAGGDAGPPSFAIDVYPIITDRCIACHTPGGSGVNSGHLDLTTNLASGAYSQLMMKAMGTVAGTAGTTCAASALTRVVPGSAAISLMYNKVNSKLMRAPALCGDPMPNPMAATPLTTQQVGIIRSWIDSGAKP
jgi:hypothetical protein